MKPLKLPTMLTIVAVCLPVMGFAASGLAPDPARAAKRLADADTNKDGQIGREELRFARQSQFDRFDRNKDGFITKADASGLMKAQFESRMTALINEFDANRDGRISRTEFVDGPTPMFDQADVNRDGVVDAAELKALKAGG